MNADEFEKQLQRQPLRGVPPKWREQILGAAAAAAAAAPAQSSQPSSSSNARPQVVVSWWREWLWPCPQAWGALASVWIIIVVLNFATSESNVPTGIAQAKANTPRQTSPSPETLLVLEWNLRLRGEAKRDMNAPQPVEPPRPGPRSQRRVETETVVA